MVHISTHSCPQILNLCLCLDYIHVHEWIESWNPSYRTDSEICWISELITLSVWPESNESSIPNRGCIKPRAYLKVMIKFYRRRRRRKRMEKTRGLLLASKTKNGVTIYLLISDHSIALNFLHGLLGKVVLKWSVRKRSLLLEGWKFRLIMPSRFQMCRKKINYVSKMQFNITYGTMGTV